MLDRLEWNDLVMLEDHLALVGLDDKPDVEEAAWELRVAGLGLSDDVGLPLACQFAEPLGLGPGDVDRALAGIGRLVEDKHLSGEPLKPTLGDADQPHRKIPAGQP